jgi:hypothetical protein
MEDIKDVRILLYVLSALWFIAISLIGYIIKTKDNTEKATLLAIKEVIKPAPRTLENTFLK